MLYRIFAFILVGAFTFSGLVMLTPQISKEMHAEMKSNFRQYHKVNPLVEHNIIQIDVDTYRQIIGIVELVCAGLIVIAPYQFALLAYSVMSILMCGALYTHYRLHHEPKQMAPSGFLLSLALYQLFGGSARTVRVKFE